MLILPLAIVIISVRFQVLTVTSIKIAVFRDVATYTLYRRFGEAYWLHHRPDKAVSSSERSVNICQTARHNIQKTAIFAVRQLLSTFLSTVTIKNVGQEG
jgi:hypothetical protein